MKSINSHSLSTSTSSNPTKDNFFPFPQAVILQLGTVSLMGAVLVHKSLAETIVSLSQASEEVFRGDRLPILPFPEPDNTTDHSTSIS